MSDGRFEREIQTAPAADDPLPVSQDLRVHIARVPDEAQGSMRARLRGSFVSGPRRSWLAPLAAVLLVGSLVATGLLGGMRRSTAPAASEPKSVSTSAAPAASPTATPSATPAYTLTSNGQTFVAPGLTSGWTAFSWTSVPDGSLMKEMVPWDGGGNGYFDMIDWAGGYAALTGRAAIGLDQILLTSSDGETWRQVDAVSNPTDIAAGPDGLVAVSRDQSGSETIWTSTDGVTWRDAGPPKGVKEIGLMAGTAVGFVAVVPGPNPGPNENVPAQSATAALVFSTDGVSWVPVDFQPGTNWYELGPQSNGSRFFLTGIYAAGTQQADTPIETGALWWSDDGRTWTRTNWSGNRSGCWSSRIKFASGGMISWTDDGQGSGASVMEVSTDGGKTWTKDAGYGPLGGDDQGYCNGSSGTIESNGSIFLAVSGSSSSSSQSQAWTSSDGLNWKPIPWGQPDSSFTDARGDIGAFLLPRGVMVGDGGATLYYGSAT